MTDNPPPKRNKPRRKSGLNRKVERYSRANPELNAIEIAAAFDVLPSYVHATSKRLGFPIKNKARYGSSATILELRTKITALEAERDALRELLPFARIMLSDGENLQEIYDATMGFEAALKRYDALNHDEGAKP